MAFDTIADADIDYRSPLNFGLAVKLRDRRDKMRSRPLMLDFAEISVGGSASYVNMFVGNIFIPDWAKTAEIAFWGKRTAGGASSTTFFQWDIGALSSSEVSQFDMTSYVAWSCSFSDLSSVQDSEQTLIGKGKDTLPHNFQMKGYGKRAWPSTQNNWGWPSRFHE
jgi:hypothetical protein